MTLAVAYDIGFPLRDFSRARSCVPDYHSFDVESWNDLRPRNYWNCHEKNSYASWTPESRDFYSTDKYCDSEGRSHSSTIGARPDWAYPLDSYRWKSPYSSTIPWALYPDSTKYNFGRMGPSFNYPNNWAHVKRAIHGGHVGGESPRAQYVPKYYVPRVRRT